MAASMRSVKKIGKWRTVDIDVNITKGTEFEGLSAFEELTDYTLLERDDYEKPRIKRKRGEEDILTLGQKKKKIYEQLHSQKEEHFKKKKKPGKLPRVEPVVEINHNSDDVDVSAWSDICCLPEPILRALRDAGFTKPSRIQEESLPAAIIARKDIVGAAETGSGKTLAFGIPILHHLIEAKGMERELPSDEGFGSEESTLKCLVLTPTRELAKQVKDHLIAIAKHTSIKVVAIVGGVSEQKQERLLKRRPEVIVATPGRFWELLEQKQPYLNTIDYLKYLVIDEADRMVETGHFLEVKHILDRIHGDAARNPNLKQIFVFSATLTMIHSLPRRVMMKKKRKPLTTDRKLNDLMATIGVNTAKVKVVDLTTINNSNLSDGPTKSKKEKGEFKLATGLSESRIICARQNKDAHLFYFLLKYPGRTLVFCNSIDCVRRLNTVLRLLQRNAFALHAELKQKQRFKNLERFTSSSECVMLATDVAARGLDIKGIQHVIHYQVPRTSESYVHRSGRTARSFSEGLSVVFIEPEEALSYKKLLKTLNRDDDLPMFPVDSTVLGKMRSVVTLAGQLEAADHHFKRKTSNKSWLSRMADACEIELDDQDEGDSDAEGAYRNANIRKDLDIKKKQLTAHLDGLMDALKGHKEFKFSTDTPALEDLKTEKDKYRLMRKKIKSMKVKFPKS